MSIQGELEKLFDAYKETKKKRIITSVTTCEGIVYFTPNGISDVNISIASKELLKAVEKT